MTWMTIVMAAVIAAELAAPLPDPNACAPADSRCRAVRLVAKARAETKPGPRAMYWHAAYREYLVLHSATGAANHLCAARRALEASLAVEGQPASQRASFERARGLLEEREAVSGRACGSRREAATRPAREGAAAGKERVGAAVAVEDEPAPLWLPINAAGLAADEGIVAAAEPRPSESAVRSATSEGASDPTTEGSQRRRRLRIAGGVMLGAGLALVGVATGAGVHVAAVVREGAALKAAMPTSIDAATRAQHEALAAEYRMWAPVAVTTAIVGGAAAITGAVLLGVSRTRAGSSARARVVPVPGGLAVHGRF